MTPCFLSALIMRLKLRKYVENIRYYNANHDNKQILPDGTPSLYKIHPFMIQHSLSRLVCALTLLTGLSTIEKKLKHL